MDLTFHTRSHLMLWKPELLHWPAEPLRSKKAFTFCFTDLYYLHIQKAKKHKMAKIVAQLLERKRKRRKRSQQGLNQEMHKVCLTLLLPESKRCKHDERILTCGTPHDFFGLKPPPSWNFRFSLYWYFPLKILALETPPPPPRNFQWPFLGWVWVFSATAHLKSCKISFNFI